MEYERLRTQIATSKNEVINSSQFVMSLKKHRDKAYLPFGFAEQGLAMLSSVSKSATESIYSST